MVDALNAATIGQPATRSPAPGAEQGTSLASDFETFLKMLTAQARYQDPLNPLDSAEYASQLAQFSSVEQSVRTNELLEQVAAQLGSHDLTSLATWIGKEVRHASAAEFKGAPLSFELPDAEGATHTDVIVYDAAGIEVDRMELAPDAATAQWAGLRQSGEMFAPGIYSFHVEQYSGDALLNAEPLYSFAKITELSVEAGQPLLRLDTGATITLDDISAVRPARADTQ